MSGEFLGSFGIANKTESAGTAIVAFIPPKRNGHTHLTTLKVKAQGTAHTWGVMQPLGRCELADDAAASQAVIKLDKEPGPSGNGIAANDYVMVELSDGTFHVGVVSSVSTLTITLTANLPRAASRRGRVWFFGVVGDTDPTTGLAHPVYNAPASATTTYEDPDGIFATASNDAPILLYNANATAAGTLEQASAEWRKW